MKYKVCIPTAGLGTRLKDISKGLNKSLIEINNKPAICYIIEQYSKQNEFIILLGYGGNIVRQFLQLVYPEYCFKFIDIDLYEGNGSGLGYTLLKARDFLQEPFIFNSCDTIVKDKIPSLDKNWMGYSIRKNNQQYRTIEEKGGVINKINDKYKSCNSEKVYIGLAGIRDYELFWKDLSLENIEFINQGESLGLRNLIKNGIHAKNFSWFDTGNVEELNKTRLAFTKENKHNILEKEGESIWFVKDKVIKYSHDKKFIENRIKRARNLKDFIPRIINHTENMYTYLKEEGEVLSSNLSKKLFLELLEFLDKFWIAKNLKSNEKKVFLNCCLDFYKTKTYQRIYKFFDKYPDLKEIKEINSQPVTSLEKLLEEIDWNYMCEGYIGRFHGDFHFENIIWNPINKKFTFIDWRQDFGGQIEYGDIYYDFAKLKHGIIIQHEFMTKNKFNISLNEKKLKFNFIRNFNHVKCEELFNSWLLKNNFSIKKVNILTALIYLNIAPLHHTNYDQLLFALGYYLLNEELQKS